MKELIFTLLYVDDVVLLSYNVDDREFFVDIVEMLYQINGSIVNVNKTNIILIKAIQPRHCLTFTNKGESIQFGVKLQISYSCRLE